MKGVLAILRRELAGLFLAPLAWILFFLALLFQAYFFLLALDRNGGEVNGALSLVLGGGWPFWCLLVVVPPLLTMRMISEESRTGLLEFLLTAPVSDAAVVVGKGLAATFFLSALWASVPLIGLLTAALGAPPDWGQVFTQWLGAALVSALFCSLGLVASALSATPLVAAFLAFLVNLGLICLPLVQGSVRGRSERLAWLIERLDVLAHFQGSFLTGALDSAHVVFFLAWTLAALFVAVRLVETRRWMG